MTPEMLLDCSDEALVDFARAGDERAIDVLLQRYRHYARAKARSYFLAGADREDIIQEGMIGLFKAISHFDVERNTAFRAFAELCITRQIITAIKTATRQKHVPLNSYVSLHKPSGASDDQDGIVNDFLPNWSVVDPADLVITAEEIDRMKVWMSGLLSSLETEVLQLFVDGNSYQEIAEMLGRHVKSIDNALQRIKRKLEQHVSAGNALPTS